VSHIDCVGRLVDNPMCQQSDCMRDLDLCHLLLLTGGKDNLYVLFDIRRGLEGVDWLEILKATIEETHMPGAMHQTAAPQIEHTA